MYIEYCYLVYLAISISVTVWVARTLYKNGRIFLVDAFHGNADLAGSVNHLLVVGFYLINLGYVTYALTTDRNVNGLRSAIELVSTKIGTILIVLGLMHLINIYVFNHLRHVGEHFNEPPVAPDSRISVRQGDAS
jgi:hypothetical protein